MIAEVEGDIEEVDGVIRITAIRVRFKLEIPAGAREKAERVLEVYAGKCPAYKSIEGCIRVASSAEMQEH